ncbi:hypothetical protein TNCV_700411 [Trichonephila clavipes]|nr:hypothetical protein TNCV_700411 [Trichonephila clavipes]
MTDSIPDKTTVPCKQSDDTNLLTDVKPTVSRHGRLVKKPIVIQIGDEKDGIVIIRTGTNDKTYPCPLKYLKEV